MRLKNDEESWFKLNQIITEFYKKQARPVSTFRSSSQHLEDSLELSFLVDQKHVVKYVIGLDRGIFLGSVHLGIGPEYFGPADFWSYENSQRFRLGTEIDDIRHNLGLLDEFFGRPSALELAHGFVV